MHSPRARVAPVAAICALLLAGASAQVALGTGVQVQANVTVDVSYDGGHEAHYLLENPTTVLLADVHVFPLLRRYPIEYMLVGFDDINSDGLPQVGYDLTFSEATTPIDVHVTPPPLIPTWQQYLAAHPSLGLVACFTNSIQNWYATFPLREYNKTAATVSIQMPYGGAYVVLAGPPSAPQYALFDFAFDTPAGNTTQVNFPAGLTLQWTSAAAHTALLHLAATSSNQQQNAVNYHGYRYVDVTLLDNADDADANVTLFIKWAYDPEALIQAGLDPNGLKLFFFDTDTGLWQQIATDNDASGPFVAGALTVPAGGHVEFSIQSTEYIGSSALSAASGFDGAAAIATSAIAAFVAARIAY